MSQIPFFALKDDLVVLLKAVEQGGALKYVQMGSSTQRTPDIFLRGAELPSLGQATSASASSCHRFLVCEPQDSVIVRPVTLTTGGTNYHVDQLENPDTIEFAPGGLWSADILLSGRVGTASADISEQSKRLMSRFRAAIERHFVRVKAYRVGDSALDFLKAGKRLTIAEQSPSDFNLQLN